MKKRLLITSIVMMLVVAVALSTATYAWFTSNANVTASTVTLNAASNGGVALGIGWKDGTTGTSITANAASSYQPMVPSALVVGTTNYDNITWSGATTYTDNNVVKFNAPYAPAPVPYQYNGTVSAATKDIFYIENLSTANSITTVTLTLDNVADTSDLLRVAVFTATTVDGDYILRAVMGNAANMLTEWGTISAAGQVVADLCADNAEIPTVTSYVINNLAAEGKVFFKVVAWLDGVALDDDAAAAQATSTLSLNFLAA